MCGTLFLFAQAIPLIMRKACPWVSLSEFPARHCLVADNIAEMTWFFAFSSVCPVIGEFYTETG